MDTQAETPWRARGKRAAGMLVLCWGLASAGCATLSSADRDRAATMLRDARETAEVCEDTTTHCALRSPLTDVVAAVQAAPTPASPQHRVLLLDEGPRALMARVHLIRSARHRIEVQTYIFDEDDVGHLMLVELLAAARRGVQVRVLVDQLAALRSVDTQARLASSHRNFELRLYNPTMHRGRARVRDLLRAAACCFHDLNQRLHSKLLLVDDGLAISGGRNYQDKYFDWDPAFDFRDRELLLVGPAVADMHAHFEAMWQAPRSVPVEQLDDVTERVLRDGVPAPVAPVFERPQRAAALVEAALQYDTVQAALVDPMLSVGNVRFVGDTPEKHASPDTPSPVADALYGAVAGAQSEVMLQTPYLVMSPRLREVFDALQRRPAPPIVKVSTNSLASTDNIVSYALLYRSRQRFMQGFAFDIHESKGFPEDAPIDIASAAPPPEGLFALQFTASTRTPREAGVRVGLHAKSMVVDGRIGIVASSNFDPRGERHNIESAVLVDDAGFAAALKASIERDMAPANAWPIARPRSPGLATRIGGWLARHPGLDLWPWRYGRNQDATAEAGCTTAPRATDCRVRRDRDFPEVGPLRRVLTRLLTSFGGGLEPLL